LPSSGTISIHGEDTKSLPARTIGYCPQNDALLPYMTPQEHLTFYANICGLPKDKILHVSIFISAPVIGVTVEQEHLG